MKKTVGATFRVLGIFAGGMSAFILAETAFEFGLSEAFGTVIGYYQALIYPLVGLLEKPLTWLLFLVDLSLPAGWKDLFVLYVICASAFVRSDFDQVFFYEKVRHVFSALLWPVGFFFLALREVVAGKVGAVMFNIRNGTDYPTDAPGEFSFTLRWFGRIFVTQVVAVLAAFFVFLLLNAVL